MLTKTHEKSAAPHASSEPDLARLNGPAIPPVTRAEKAAAASFARRWKAAGMTDEVPEDIDEFRMQLARQIYMYVNEWRGCPQRLCRRNQGCMAPEGRCSNVPQEELSWEEWEPVRDEVRKALDELKAANPDVWD